MNTSQHALGEFIVNISPPVESKERTIENLARFALDKEFQGDLEASSQGQMLTAATETENSAVYVAMERIVGTLHGKKGSFVLHHTGIMNRGEDSLEITVVPDSGTDELSGITGSFAIAIAEGKHTYDFTYQLPEIN